MYTDINDIQTELGEKELLRLTNPDGEQIDTAKIENAAKYADSVIDAYLSGYYDVPLLEPVPGIIKKIAKELTINGLYEAAHSKTSVPNTIVWKKIDAMKLLQELRNGSIRLVGARANSAVPVILSNKDL